MCSTILGDIYPEHPASALAALNIVRCTFQAAGLAALQAMIDNLGVGGCFTLLVPLCGTMLLVVRAETKGGMKWRSEREN